MKVILLQDVANIGKRFDVAEVPDGHAMNKLIPQGMAQVATPENLKRVEARAAKATADQASDDAQFEAALAALKDQTLTITVEANDQGGLFEALKAEAIVAAAAEVGATLATEQVVLDEPVKEIGDQSVTVRAGERTGSVALNVVAK